MHCRLLIIALLVLFPCISEAKPRLWKNTNATRSFRGEFVQQEGDKVTIKMIPSGRQVTVMTNQLHADDVLWLKERLTNDAGPAIGKGPQNAPGAFYDTLAFGDDKPTVIKKLKKSERFHSELNETFFARTGLNGTFRTTKGNEFFGMEGALYYGWSEQDTLKFLSLYGHETAPAQVESSLVPTWKEMIKHIDKHFGKAKSSSPKPEYAGLGDSEITFTHVWPLEGGGSLLLGVGKQDGKYVIIARFTSEQH